MRFRHSKGVRLALLSGHVVHVGQDWVELHPRFQQDAVLAGCEVEQSIIPSAPKIEHHPSQDAFVNTDDTSVVRRALQVMLERDEAGDFTASTGLPSIKALEKLAGIQVNKGEVYRIFRELKAEAGVDVGTEGVAE